MPTPLPFTIHGLTPPLLPEPVKFLSRAELEGGTDAGTLTLIVRRPAVDVRETLDEGWLDPLCGLAGDSWSSRSNPRKRGGTAHTATQLTIMNTRAIALIAPDVSRWPLAGDQLYIEMDLSVTNLPPGSRLAIGEAVIEVTSEPHTGVESSYSVLDSTP